jgi:hypothetical protein
LEEDSCDFGDYVERGEENCLCFSNRSGRIEKKKKKKNKKKFKKKEIVRRQLSME